MPQQAGAPLCHLQELHRLLPYMAPLQEYLTLELPADVTEEMPLAPGDRCACSVLWGQRSSVLWGQEQ